MMRETARRLTVLISVPSLLVASAAATQAQSHSIGHVPSIQEAALRHVPHVQRGRLHRIPQRRPCNPKRRALVGGAIGAVVGMVAVRRAVEEKGGSIGARDTLRVGGLGAALGAFVGVKSCL